MANLHSAYANPEMIAWARKYVHLSIDEAAKKVGVSEERFSMWENGEEYPTIHQLFKLAKICKISLAAFYLEEPPYSPKLPVSDFRKIPGVPEGEIPFKLASEIRYAEQIRSSMIELLEEMDETVPMFDFSIDFNSTIEEIGKKIRDYFGITSEMQKKWKTDKKAFDSFRQLMERKNILVIQAFEIETSIMRGFSLSFSPFPVIVVNHNDSFTGRSFTLFHEFAHIATNTSGLCNESGSSKIEVICNQIAAEVLMPKDVFIESVKEIFNSVVEHGWDDYCIENLATNFGVSREAIVRRLLTYKFVSQEFYEKKRKEYQAELDHDKVLKIEAIKNSESKKGPMGLCKGTVIYARVRNGSSIPDIIVDAYFSKKISFVEASKILQLKSKNFNKLVNQYI